jgi:hypothetical protein
MRCLFRDLRWSKEYRKPHKTQVQEIVEAPTEGSRNVYDIGRGIGWNRLDRSIRARTERTHSRAKDSAETA